MIGRSQSINFVWFGEYAGVDVGYASSFEPDHSTAPNVRSNPLAAETAEGGVGHRRIVDHQVIGALLLTM